MIILIGGASHSGKTKFAQALLEKYKYPYLSLDHLKMGLIRSEYTKLNVMDDTGITNYLWPIVREIIKTVIENGQNLIVEGCYIPFDWQKDFTNKHLSEIRHIFLILSSDYIKKNFTTIKSYANIIERRLDDSDYTMEQALRDNVYTLKMARKFAINYLLIEDKYPQEIYL